jgi:hypothetical protein
MACGLPGALSVMVIDELRGPVVKGVKVALMVQVPLGGRGAPQLFVCAKSPVLPPDIATALMTS